MRNHTMTTTTTFILLGLLAFGLAIQAALRVRDKRRLQIQTPAHANAQSISSSSKLRPSTSVSGAVKESEATQATATVTAPDRQQDLVSAAQASAEAPSSEQQAANQAEQQIASLSQLVENDVPFAASLSVSDLIPTDASQASGDRLEDVDPAANSSTAHDLPHGLIEEIAELGRSGAPDRLTTLLQHADHPDYLVRVATAVALGELASHHQGQLVDDSVACLNQLLADADLQVRTEAAAALGRLGMESGVVSGAMSSEGDLPQD